MRSLLRHRSMHGHADVPTKFKVHSTALSGWHTHRDNHVHNKQLSIWFKSADENNPVDG